MDGVVAVVIPLGIVTTKVAELPEGVKVSELGVKTIPDADSMIVSAVGGGDVSVSIIFDEVVPDKTDVCARENVPMIIKLTGLGVLYKAAFVPETVKVT